MTTLNLPENPAATDVLLEGFDQDPAMAMLDADDNLDAAATAVRQARNIPEMMRKIPVTVTLEVGSARISLQELMAIRQDSVVELDRLAGEPLVIKVNGTPIGRGEVVVAGENYGLKVLDLDGLNMDLVAQ